MFFINFNNKIYRLCIFFSEVVLCEKKLERKGLDSYYIIISAKRINMVGYK